MTLLALLLIATGYTMAVLYGTAVQSLPEFVTSSYGWVSVGMVAAGTALLVAA